MNPIFSLKNFRCYGEDGADFEIAPITILTGCNSAGKSTLVKAMLLQEQVSSAIVKKDSTNEIELRLSDKELCLGTFKKHINKSSSTGVITISYTVHSYLLAEDVKVTLEYVEDKKNVIGNGVLSKILIEKNDGTIIYSEVNLQTPASSIEKKNYLSILENYKRFAIYGRYEKALSSKNIYDENVDVFAENSSKEKEQILQMEYRSAKSAYEEYNISKKEEIGYLYTKRLDDVFQNKYALIGEWLKSGTMFHYLPLFKEMHGKDKTMLRQYLLNEIENGGWGESKERVQDWANHFADDFESSDKETFLDFFLSLEHKAMAKGLIDDTPGSWGFNGISIAEVLDDFSEREYTPEERRKNNRMNREEYDRQWTFMSVVSALDDICCFKGEHVFFSRNDNSPLSPWNRWAIKDSFKRFLIAVLYESLTPRFLQNVKYINSSSALIKRLYSIEESDKFAVCLKQYLTGPSQNFDFSHRTQDIVNAQENGYKQGDFINKWIRRFQIGDAIHIKGTDEGLGVLIYLEKDGELRLLADEGYGISQLVVLLLQIETQITTATIRQIAGECSVVYKPIYDFSSIYVEEPETHLHPKFQSLLADMFVEAYQEYKIRFIIETHSEYLIRKLQVMVADKDISLTPDEVSLNYVEKDETTGISTNRQIKVLDDGRLSEPFGTGFLDEAGNRARDLLLFKAQRI
jgi:predicted ATPase